MSFESAFDQLSAYKRLHGRKMAKYLQKYRKELKKCENLEDFVKLLKEAEHNRSESDIMDSAFGCFDSEREALSNGMKEEGIRYLRVKSASPKIKRMMGDLYITPDPSIEDVKTFDDTWDNRCKIAILAPKNGGMPVKSDISDKYLNWNALSKAGAQVKRSLNVGGSKPTSAGKRKVD
jgi:hypothetical protein